MPVIIGIRRRMRRNAFLVIAVLFWTFASGLFAISMWTHHWRSANPGVGSSYNLYLKCDSPTNCAALDFIPSAANLFTTVPLLLMLLGTILNVAGLVFAFVGFCFNTNCNNLFESDCLPCCDCCSCAAESIICTAGGLAVCGGCAAFTALNYKTDRFYRNEYFDYSFFLGWAAGGIYLVTGGIFFYSDRY